MAKRAYSRDFTPRTEQNLHINVARVPKTLLLDFRQRCRAQKISQRSLLLTWIRNWLDGRRPDEDGSEVTPAQP